MKQNWANRNNFCLGWFLQAKTELPKTPLSSGLGRWLAYPPSNVRRNSRLKPLATGGDGDGSEGGDGDTHEEDGREEASFEAGEAAAAVAGRDEAEGGEEGECQDEEEEVEQRGVGEAQEAPHCFLLLPVILYFIIKLLPFSTSLSLLKKKIDMVILFSWFNITLPMSAVALVITVWDVQFVWFCWMGGGFGLESELRSSFHF